MKRIRLTTIVVMVVALLALSVSAALACYVGTPGYWKNHPEAWPVGSITIGGVTYTRDQAIAKMQMPVAGDKTYTMFDALVAAKLNVVPPETPQDCINATIAAADAWMVAHPLGSGVRGPAWQAGDLLYLQLDAYNNGKLCAPSRD